jgi:tetratricopeptide (TPR) repeat protein
LLGSVIAQYPTTPHAGTARLNRAILALRGHREDDGARELGEVIRAHGASVIDHRRRTLDALVVQRGDAPVQLSMVATVPASAERAAPTGAAERADSRERFAAKFVEAGDLANAPYVLHGLTLLAAADGGWSDDVVVTLVHRLADVSPSYPAAPSLLTRVATAAASAGQWPTARRSYEELVARYPDSALSAGARVDFAEALVRVGAKAEARTQLEQVVTVAGDYGPRALRLLSEVEETLGPSDRTRPLLQRIVNETSDREVAGEAAYRVGRLLSTQGQHPAAVEWHMTTAYVAQESRWARLALLDAGRSLMALQRPNEALIVYRKLVPQSPAGAAQDGGLPPALLARAGQPEERAVMAEAANGIASILQDAGDHEKAVDMYLTAANLTAGAPASRRALLGAMRSLVAIGDRASAEVIYRRLQESSETEPALLGEARKLLSSTKAGTAQDGAAALPGSVIK